MTAEEILHKRGIYIVDNYKLETDGHTWRIVVYNNNWELIVKGEKILTIK